MTYQFMRFPGGKPKAVTLSYDDGTISDVRLTETVNKYEMKCTYNLVGSLVEEESRLSIDYIKNEILGNGHEVASHGYYHRSQNKIRSIESIREILDCRMTLEGALGTIIRGFAYPDISPNRFAEPDTYRRIKSNLSETDIAYARCDGNAGNFFLPDDFHSWVPTAHHENPDIMKYIDEFVALDLNELYISRREPRLFFLWGHSSEFNDNNNWEHLEDICQRLSGKSDVWYATNIEICDYVSAYKSLRYSADGTIIYNPTLYTLWFDVDGRLYSIKPGETITL